MSQTEQPGQDVIAPAPAPVIQDEPPAPPPEPDRRPWAKVIQMVAKRVGGKKALSAEMGVSENSIHNWIAGRRSPKPDILRTLVELYRANPAYLLTGVGDPLLRDLDTSLATRRLNETAASLIQAVTHLSTSLAWIAPMLTDEQRTILAGKMSQAAIAVTSDPVAR